MRDRIVKRLAEERTDALESIAIAVSKTTDKARTNGALGNSRLYLSIDEDHKTGVATYIDQCARFIHQVAGSSFLNYQKELCDELNELKRQLMDKMERQHRVKTAFPGNSSRAEQRKRLGPALDNIIKRKLEDFQLGIIEGQKMEPKDAKVTHNTVNIINSNISNAVMTITQSGTDTVSKEVAKKIEEIMNLEEIKALPEATQLEVLDHAEVVVDELNKPILDEGKVLRSLKRLGSFLKNTGTEVAAKFAAELAVAWAKSHGG